MDNDGGIFYVGIHGRSRRTGGRLSYSHSSERGGTHWTRYFGNLEGISEETKKLAQEARNRSGKGMSEWLDEIVKKAAEDQLNKKNS